MFLKTARRKSNQKGIDVEITDLTTLFFLLFIEQMHIYSDHSQTGTRRTTAEMGFVLEELRKTTALLENSQSRDHRNTCR